MESNIFIFFRGSIQVGKKWKGHKIWRGGWNVMELDHFYLFFGGELRSVRDNIPENEGVFLQRFFPGRKKTAPMKNPWDVCISFVYLPTFIIIYHKSQPFMLVNIPFVPRMLGAQEILAGGFPRIAEA